MSYCAKSHKFVRIALRDKSMCLEVERQSTSGSCGTDAQHCPGASPAPSRLWHGIYNLGLFWWFSFDFYGLVRRSLQMIMFGGRGLKVWITMDGMSPVFQSA